MPDVLLDGRLIDLELFNELVDWQSGDVAGDKRGYLYVRQPATEPPFSSRSRCRLVRWDHFEEFLDAFAPLCVQQFGRCEEGDNLMT